MVGNVFDSKLVRALPDLHFRGWGVWRVGWNFRPKWDKSLQQDWYGRWWVWLGPYMIGRRLSDA